MQKTFKVWLPFIFSIFLAIGILLGAKMSPQQASGRSDDPTKKFKEVIGHISKSYVDDVVEEDLVDFAIKQVIEELDPHSFYISAEELTRVNENLEGNFDGIGVEFSIIKDTITVVSAISGGPSEALGIRAGDKIIKIEDETVAGKGISNNDVIQKLRGKKGTRVKVSISRQGEKELLDFVITRDKIPIYSIDASYMIDNEVAYIKINRFSGSTIREFDEAVAELQKQGMEKLILDLSGNPGGYLEAAIRICDHFISKDKILLYTEGKHNPKRTYKSSRKGALESNTLVIIIDEGSASASEIVSGAIQDWDRGIIVGRRSFGKGLVQEQINLSDKSAIRLTVAKYYTPSGRCIQKPYENGNEDYNMELMRRYFNGELTGNDSVAFPDSLKYRTNAGRTVYGGGGIMPDVYVPIDTSYNTSYLNHVFRKGLLYQFSLEYLNLHRKGIERNYKSIIEYENNFLIDNTMLAEFRKYCDKEGEKASEEEFQKSAYVITYQIKGLLARQIYGESAYYRIVNAYDDSFRKALKIIQNQ